MVPRPENSLDRRASEFYINHDFVPRTTVVDRPTHLGESTTAMSKQWLFTTKRTRRRKKGISILSYVFFIGFLLIGSLNIVYFHRLNSYADESSPSNFSTAMRGFAAMSPRRLSKPIISVSNHDEDIIARKPPEVSACMIVMDDNHFLIEWLAYHYHTANLRHLIITSDPHSKTSPSKVLDRWRDRITIQEWNETNFLPSDFEDQVKDNSFDQEKLEVLNNHRLRQASFNVECLKELKRQNRGWTLMIDTDEYLIPKETLATKLNDNTTVTPTIADVLATLQIPAGFEKVYSPCLPINREQFSTAESPEEKVQSMVAPGFDGRDFQTLRWRKHGFEPEWIETHWGTECGIVRDIPNKVMIDLARITLEDLDREDHLGNPHKPLNYCPKNVYSHMRETPFAVHHYMGTPEQWFYRSNDKRGLGYRKARYEDMNERFGAKESDAIRPWLSDFIEAVGSAEASRLLKDVGKLEILPDSKVGNERQTATNKYKVGDVVETNFAGEGSWFEGEIYAAYSDNYYSVFFEDCTTEIATFAERMRPINTTTPKTESASGSSDEDDDEESNDDEE